MGLAQNGITQILDRVAVTQTCAQQAQWGSVMTESHQMDWRAQAAVIDGPCSGLHRSPVEDTHFKSLLLRLDAATDVPGFWGIVQSILNEVVSNEAEQGDFSAQEIALLNRLHPYIQATLQRLSAPAELEANGHRREGPTATSVKPALGEMLDRLTPAERKLLELVGEGFSNKEVAARLHKSVRTVKTQLTSVYKKFGVRSRSRLLALMR
jgi:DNA-binding CsgD family transcriptional regulator